VRNFATKNIKICVQNTVKIDKRLGVQNVYKEFADVRSTVNPWEIFTALSVLATVIIHYGYLNRLSESGRIATIFGMIWLRQECMSMTDRIMFKSRSAKNAIILESASVRWVSCPGPSVGDDPDISPGHIPPEILPRTFPSRAIPPPFLHRVGHFPLLPPTSANLQYKATYRYCLLSFCTYIFFG